jgi:hypothetical protein
MNKDFSLLKDNFNKFTNDNWKWKFFLFLHIFLHIGNNINSLSNTGKPHFGVNRFKRRLYLYRTRQLTS